MKFGKYVFENIEEFQSIQKLALANGIGTIKDFFNYLRENYSHKLVNN
ncbi:hypothetical protein [Aliarcobacter skirrowii]|uniref:Uncharacterized protein n=1 Tax=Aliarcobacter skirrowii TaxID=28200 RepID=A0AAW9DA48_9BACT|nr:hypothetical protein [Aliarcobacter skirrowii]MDX4069158.1 hypothetical protein [Aliarcobacter skirrowii]